MRYISDFLVNQNEKNNSDCQRWRRKFMHEDIWRHKSCEAVTLCFCLSPPIFRTISSVWVSCEILFKIFLFDVQKNTDPYQHGVYNDVTVHKTYLHVYVSHTEITQLIGCKVLYTVYVRKRFLLVGVKKYIIVWHIWGFLTMKFCLSHPQFKYGVRSPKFICAPCMSTSLLHWPRQRKPQHPPPPHLGSYTWALLVSLERRHLFVTSWAHLSNERGCL